MGCEVWYHSASPLRFSPMANALYHASTTPGMKIFQPRPCWFNADLTQSTPLSKPSQNLPGGVVKNCVFVGDEKFVSYFCFPPKARRFGILKAPGDYSAALDYLGIKGKAPAEIFIFEKRAEKKVRAHTFHVYKFRKSDFKQFPSGEYIAEKAVVPLSEVEKSDPVNEIEKRGVRVVFVADIEACYRKLSRMKVRIHIVTNIREASKAMIKQSAKRKTKRAHA